MELEGQPHTICNVSSEQIMEMGHFHKNSLLLRYYQDIESVLFSWTKTKKQ